MPPALEPERPRAAYRAMLLARALEDHVAKLYRAGGQIVGGVYLSRGQEAFSAALGVNLLPNDIYGPLIRDTAGRLAFGQPVLDYARTYVGSALGPMRGRDGNVHHGRPREGIPAMISHLGSLVSVVCGMLFARRYLGVTGCVGATCIGEGGTSTGAFHEALNLAAVEGLPLVVAVANNQYAYSTHQSRQFHCRNLADRAAGYGMSGYEVNGVSLLESVETFQRAVAAARAGEGPQLVVGALLRLSGHGEHDDASYVDPALLASPLGRDCLTVAHEELLAAGMAGEKELEGWTQAARAEAERVFLQAQLEPAPDPTSETWRAISSQHFCEFPHP
ncbi:MAG TPA: thiamine pyrophosphate-dependent dehydrogenase E1 component subunit alpha [Verrucomicrobiales bacterium]|nr:thiamine pyrophosphate-dependent dehydrogenase E1 component subunit alpha [Verrucomicrobiales bacterium]